MKDSIRKKVLALLRRTHHSVHTHKAFIQGKSTLAAALTAGLLGVAVCGTPTAHAAFTDVPSGHWAYTQVEAMTQKGVLSGYPDGSFRPNTGVTREEFCKMLMLAFALPAQSPSTSPFSDVAPTRWSYSYIVTTKDFLTGYRNPLGGLPTFRPSAAGTREEIAAALVRVLGLSTAQAQPVSFTDKSSITTDLVPYVSVASIHGLVQGYPDGSFVPRRGVTRAEAVMLLDRALAQSSTSAPSSTDWTLSAQVISAAGAQTAVVQITTAQGASVTVDGTAVAMSDNGSGHSEGSYRYAFQKDESRTFVIQATKDGVTKTARVTASYQSPAPTLVLDAMPTYTSADTFTLSGTVTNGTVTVNGAAVTADSKGRWSHTLSLTAGQNTIMVVATNTGGSSVSETVIVTREVGGPTLTLLECPATTSADTLTLRGTVTDPTYTPLLTINGTSVYVDSAGNWTFDATLHDGDNLFTFVATGAPGATTTEQRTIKRTVGSPTLVLTHFPSDTTDAQVRLEGRVQGERTGAVLWVNDIEVAVEDDGSFVYDLSLTPDETVVTVRVQNTYGKTATLTRTIVYTEPIA